MKYPVSGMECIFVRMRPDYLLAADQFRCRVHPPGMSTDGANFGL